MQLHPECRWFIWMKHESDKARSSICIFGYKDVISVSLGEPLIVFGSSLFESNPIFNLMIEIVEW